MTGTDVRLFRVGTADGLSLAASEFPAVEGAPVIIAVHGYPDNQSVWSPVVERLSPDFRVVTYDVRGTGGSDDPASRDGYRIEQLNADLAAVADAVSPDAPVHLLAHDWGSIQTWEAVMGNLPAGRIASYTSISGPSLDQVGVWLRGLVTHGLRGARDRLKQIAESSYVWFFQTPGLPEAAWRSGIVDKLLAASSKIGRPAGVVPTEVERSERDRINGIELYRANVLPRLRRPRPRVTPVPVQLIVPSKDLYVSPALARGGPAPYVPDLTIVDVEGGHWIVLDQPDLIAGLVRDFVTAH